MANFLSAAGLQLIRQSEGFRGQVYNDVAGFPTIGYGPGGQDYHAVNERARVKDLVQSAQIYANLLTSFAG